MPQRDSREQFERALAAAHKWLWIAEQRGEDLFEDLACQELHRMTNRVVEITERSVSGRTYRGQRETRRTYR